MPASDRSSSMPQTASLPRPVADTAAAASLPEIPGGWTTNAVPVGHRRFRLLLPANPDSFLDDPQVQRANAESDYMPYWAYLWPAASDMAALVLNEKWRSDLAALELGAGIGLVGVAALTAGLRVTFSDYDNTSLSVASHNAELNGVHAQNAVLLDWRNPEASTLRRFQVVLGCDVLYEVPLHADLLNVLDRHLTDDGVCWLGDPGRTAFDSFCSLARSRGYSVELRDELGKPLAAGARDQPAFRLAVLHRHQSQDRPATK